MASQSSFVLVLTLALVFGVPQFHAEVREDSYATVAANGDRLIGQLIQIAPDEDANIDDPGEGVLRTPQHPWDADRIAP